MERIEHLLKLLGHPEHKLKCIHVAGTNGKGSVSALLAAVLQCQGYKTGVYTSPHLQSYRERFVVNGDMIAQTDFVRLVRMLQPCLEQVLRETHDHPTEFELLTAMAFLYFYEQEVDYAIIEVGLGGTLDSTNVITPLVSVITNVCYDHMDRLGKGLREIAAHKAGIIKEAVPVITAARGEPMTVIQEIALSMQAPVIDVWQTCNWHLASSAPGGQIFHLTTAREQYDNLRISLLGPHQLVNSAVAVATLEHLRDQGVNIERKAIYEGFSQARWPGRFEIVAQEPLIILDGAHNPDGSMALRATFETVFPGCETVFVVGVLADKNYKAMLNNFAAVADLMILTTADSPRAADPAMLAEEVSGCKTMVISDLKEAIGAGMRLAAAGKILCICGSFYTIGRARDILLGSG
jgi:dihydrofolate synthase/folylpolyglutamate synthase